MSENLKIVNMLLKYPRNEVFLLGGKKEEGSPQLFKSSSLNCKSRTGSFDDKSDASDSPNDPQTSLLRKGSMREGKREEGERKKEEEGGKKAEEGGKKEDKGGGWIMDEVGWNNFDGAKQELEAGGEKVGGAREEGGGDRGVGGREKAEEEAELEKVQRRVIIGGGEGKREEGVVVGVEIGETLGGGGGGREEGETTVAEKVREGKIRGKSRDKIIVTEDASRGGRNGRDATLGAAGAVTGGILGGGRKEEEENGRKRWWRRESKKDDYKLIMAKFISKNFAFFDGKKKKKNFVESEDSKKIKSVAGNLKNASRAEIIDEIIFDYIGDKIKSGDLVLDAYCGLGRASLNVFPIHKNSPFFLRSFFFSDLFFL